MGDSVFDAYHKHYGLTQCIRCFKPIEDANHHYYCNNCWIRNQLGIICTTVDNLFKNINNNTVEGEKR